MSQEGHQHRSNEMPPITMLFLRLLKQNDMTLFAFGLDYVIADKYFVANTIGYDHPDVGVGLYLGILDFGKYS